MAWPKTHRPEDHLGRNMSPERGVAASMQSMHGSMRDDKTFQMTPYSIMNPFSMENEQALRESQKAWLRKMKLIEDAEKAKEALTDYGRRMQTEGAKGLQPGGTKESQMRKIWSLQDTAEKAQSELDAYWAKRENLKELKGKRRGKFYPDQGMRDRKKDPFAGVRRVDQGRFGRTPGLTPPGYGPYAAGSSDTSGYATRKQDWK